MSYLLRHLYLTSNHSKQSAKTAPEQPAVQANVQNPSVVDKMMICVYCLKQINEKQAFPVGTAHVNSYICMVSSSWTVQ